MDIEDLFPFHQGGVAFGKIWLTHVFAGNVTKDKELRYISGNVLTGYETKHKISYHLFASPEKYQS